MAGQWEFDLRATLCRQLAQREPENRALWMAEAENWSRLSKEGNRGAAEERICSGIAASLRVQAERTF
ncbi:hypothetical protein IVB22_23670 [Bradyrhizobium sp. 190]|uniref:hypothetical protein n=1 Tax=Bradyrhizobium sp. 190 TaxID=2782658 RepID=UPI001FF91AD6|nr:hypothetical protein [Bradyrhizobium sp. 190]MCK1515496.1 hypothetical protein [Bradyrhizobium sp. 190]